MSQSTTKQGKPRKQPVNPDKAFNPDPFLNAQEAAAYLGMSVRWIRRSVEERRIRMTKLGGRLAFKRSWLDAYAMSQVVEPEGDQ